MKNYVKLFESWLNEEEGSKTTHDDAQEFINSLGSMKVSDLKAMGIEKLGKNLANLFEYLGLVEKNNVVKFNASKKKFENFNGAKVFKDEILYVQLDDIEGKDSEPATDPQFIQLYSNAGGNMVSLGQLLSAVTKAYTSSMKIYSTDFKASTFKDSWNKDYAILTGKDKAKSQLLADKIGGKVGDISPKEVES